MTAYTVHELDVPATMDDAAAPVQALRDRARRQNAPQVPVTRLPDHPCTPRRPPPFPPHSPAFA